MARILFVNIAAEGHVNPTLGLVKELVEHGEEVVYVCTEEFRNKITSTGAQFRPYTLNEQVLAELGFSLTDVKHPLQFIEYLLRGLIEHQVPEILKLTKDDSFDFIVFDSMFGWGGYLLSEKLGIPSICSITHLVVPKVPNQEMPPIDTGDFDVAALIERIMTAAHQIAAEHNVDVPTIEDIAGKIGEHKLVFTSRYFQPYADLIDDSYVFTGPSIASREDAPDFPLERLHSKYEQVVYISMGTVLNKDVQFYKLCFEAFTDIPAQFVLSCGKDTDLSELTNSIPPHFIIEPYVPQLEILQRADAFITHAGMNSTSEGLYYNVPLVMIPLSTDQPYVAARVQELGAGIMLDKNSLTPEVLKSSLLQILTDASYKTNAAKIGDSFREAGGHKAAAKHVMTLFSKV
ncbi:glycosyl transferase [Paenibacillus sp. SC116]|uniref:macrolide family glycosyltransferase n=1 Tax=Paenibacillus sp. SC116 TaxID=2968986 RepID=UPI00215B084E|nr:macrolide family glycosyltransferase [Paenibacillus sp. SC116]MCR8842272.1 glycosyl transferase [Paenibacillus sp. SC116]